jgi:hypothetical protein
MIERAARLMMKPTKEKKGQEKGNAESLNHVRCIK